MKTTKDGYFLPENDAETAAAIEHNTILAGSKGLATHEELMKRAKLNKPGKKKQTSAEESKKSTNSCKILSQEEIEIVRAKLQNPHLIELIRQELDKYHKHDNKEKTAVFIIGISGYLPNPNDHCSAALKGDSSAGKDNIVKTSLRHLPDQDSFFLTRGTQSALEEASARVKIIAFSEINAGRDDGANKDLTEFFKQLSEGGCRIIKRDKITNEVIDIQTEQKTLFYGTTEAHSDDELQTRYVVIPVKGYEAKNKAVVESTLNAISTAESYFHLSQKDNWVKQAISQLDPTLDVIIPYAPYLNNPIQDQEGKQTFLFDMTKERVKRDVKRLISLTKAIAWLHQKQRITQEYEGHKFILAEPQDFQLAFYLFMDFFDLTYSGIDPRVMTIYTKIKELEGSQFQEIGELGFSDKYSYWVLRHRLQAHFGWTVNTIKKYCDELENYGLLEGFYDRSIPRGYLLRTNRVSIGYQKAIRDYQLRASDTLLIPYFDTLSQTYGKQASDETQKRWTDFKPFFANLPRIFEDFDTLNLTPSKCRGDKRDKITEQIDKFLVKQPVEYDTLVKNLQAAGHDTADIEQLIGQRKKQGDLFEPRPGIIALLK